MVKGVKVLSSGYYVPKRVVGNDYFERKNPFFEYEFVERGVVRRGREVVTSDDWIMKRMGVKERRWAHTDESLSDMAAEAVKNALYKIDMPASGLAGIIIASVTQDMQFPSAADQVIEKIGACNAHISYDLAAACAGFPLALRNARNEVKENRGTYAVVGAERLSGIIDETDSNCMLFGDGAGAMIVGSSNESREFLLNFYSLKDTSEGRTNWIFRDKEGKLRMPFGRCVFRDAIFRLKEATLDLARNSGWGLEEVNQYLYSQANARINGKLVGDLKLEDRQVFSNIFHLGNTSAASVPICYAQAVEDGRIVPGSKVIIAAVGAGLSVSGASLIA